MAKIQPVWSLDIGQAAVKALKLIPGETPDQVFAEAFDFIEYPKILSQPDADPEQLVREALETFLERNDIKGCKVAIAVPGQAGLVKFIKLPPVEKKRIPDIVKFEARQQIPFALDEVVWAYQQIGGDDSEGDDDFTMAEVGLFAMKRDQINRAILPFKIAGIEVDIVQMSPIALYNFITFDRLKGAATKESIVLLDIGADNTDLIITDGTRIWQRNVPIGGNHFTRALTKELKLTFAKAEHLKRNATKAPDPRSIFTAMRGVFNDFSSEINRSIGFYGSVNRGAKIDKIIGLGNGFKLPGLQKFLQQNLSQEIEKLDTFAKLEGDEVKGQPVFQDNLPSFAVCYGLAVQGLRKSGLSTNLLPPEIEQVRMIRAKKPWVLAASAFLMLGFSGLFLGEYRLFAKVSSQGFKEAVSTATSVSKTGAAYKSDFEAAKTAWTGKEGEGKALVGDAADRDMWPEFLETLSFALPDPVRDYKLDPNNPDDQPRIDKLAVHIDAIKPVWREDVAAEWFSSETSPIRPDLKSLMHPLDRDNAPEGPGWIIQLVGHHYNPYPMDPKELSLPPDKRTAYGPINFIAKKIIPSLLDPKLRLYGVHHVVLVWMTQDKEWTSEKGSQTNGLAGNTVPLLMRAAAPAGESAGGEMGGMASAMMGRGGKDGGMGGMAGMMGGMAGAMGGRGGQAAGGGKGGRGGMEGMMGGMGMNNADSKKNLTTLTRTDFLIQFVWSPKPDEIPKDPEELKTKLEELRTQLVEAEKGSVVTVPVDEKAIEDASLKQSKAVDADMQQAVQPGAGGAVNPSAPQPPAAPATPTPPATPKK